MNGKSRKNTQRSHLVVVGFDDIVCNKYLSCVEEAINAGYIDSYSVVELESQKIVIEEKINHIKLKPTSIYYLPDRRKDGVYANQKDLEPIFREIKQNMGKLKVYIATELKAHETYLKYCIENNIDSLVEKPILAPMKDGRFNPELIESSMQSLLSKSENKFAKHSVMTASRYHKIYNEKVLKPLAQKMIELSAPLTSFHLRHSGGVWNLHREYELLEDHPYKYGYGMIMHGGYHYIDLAVQFLKLNKLIFPNNVLSLTISSYAAYPTDQNDRIPKKFNENFGDDCPDWPPESESSKYGETDMVTSFCLKKKDTGKIITVGTISLEQTTPSIRMWKDIPPLIYNKNGRVSYVELGAQLSTLHSVHVQCVDVPQPGSQEVDRISAFARISRMANASLLRGEEYNAEETHHDFFHSDSNRRLMSAWLRGEEHISQLADHIETMRLAQYMAMSIRKSGYPVSFDM